MQLSIIWFVLAGPIWAAIGAWWLPRVYRSKGLDDSQARLVGGLGGLTLGPLVLVPLWIWTPQLKKWYWGWGLGVLAALQLYALFALMQPKSLCVTNSAYVANQAANGLVIGSIYALMAVGLTLIYSVQGVISFAHGQFYMLGGYASYYFLLFLAERLGIELNPIVGVPVAGLVTMLLGSAFERAFLRPMHLGRIERPGEYAILITFGLGFFLQYTMLAIVGPFSQKTETYMQAGAVHLGPLNLIPNRLIAAAVGILLIGLLLYLLNRTWTGKALRAVSMDKQAAAVTGINPLRMNTLAFGIGCMLAGMSGAALIRQTFGDFNHGGTFSHHAVGAAAALATMDYMEEHALVAGAVRLGAYLGQRLRESLGDVDSVGDVRGIGMMWGVEFVADRETKAPFPPGARFSNRVCGRCMEMGVLFYPGHGGVDGVQGDHLMVAPPYVVTEGQIDTMVETLRQAIQQVAAATQGGRHSGIGSATTVID